MVESLSQRELWRNRLISTIVSPSTLKSSQLHSISRAAFERGLIREGGKLGLMSELADVMPYVKPDGQPPRCLEQLNIEQIAQETGKDLERIKTLTELMTEFSLIRRQTDGPTRRY